MITEFSENYLKGRSYSSNDVKTLIEGHFDLIIMSSTWDRRCVCIIENDLSADYSIMLKFKLRDEYGLQDDHDEKIYNYLLKITKNKPIKEIFEESINVDKFTILLSDKIYDVFLNNKGQMNVLLDLSTCPRYYALSILAILICHGLISKLTISYAEGIYSHKDLGCSNKLSFSKGKWKTIPISSFSQISDPEKMKYLMVSIGYEGNKTIRAVNRVDPNRISILFPDPGVTKEHVKKVDVANEELLEFYKVPENQIVRVHAADAIGVWKSLSEANLEKPEENIFYLCCGTKPHAIGLALRAISLGHPKVLYNIPSGGHSFVDVEPYGVYWKYEIEDISALPNK